jgi:hypothetical protein
MKYIFIPFGFFPIYLVFKLLGFIFVIFLSLFVYVWSLSFERTQEVFQEWNILFSNMTLNPFYAWYHFLDGLEELDLI